MRTRPPHAATSLGQDPIRAGEAGGSHRSPLGRSGRLRVIHRSGTLCTVTRSGHNGGAQRPAGLLHPDTHQGNFGEHLVQLIVTSAGFDCYKPNDFGDGIDLAIAWTHPDGEEIRPPNMELQVKSSRVLRSVGDSWSFDLEVAHYNSLRTLGATRRYLVLVDIRSENHTDWVGFGSDFAVFHKKAYWVDLQGKPATTNTSTIAVHVPKVNVLTPQVVHGKMLDARAGFYALFGLLP